MRARVMVRPCWHLFLQLAASGLVPARGRVPILQSTGVDHNIASDYAAAAASSCGFFLVSVPALHGFELARRKLASRCKVQDLHMFAACGVDVDPETSRYTQSLLETTSFSALGGQGGALWMGIAFFEPRLHGTPWAANKVLAARPTRVCAWGVHSSVEAPTCTKLGCSLKWAGVARPAAWLYGAL